MSTCPACTFENKSSAKHCAMCSGDLVFLRENEKKEELEISQALSNSLTIVESQSPSWTCSECTFINNGAMHKCEMCSTNRVLPQSTSETGRVVIQATEPGNHRYLTAHCPKCDAGINLYFFTRGNKMQLGMLSNPEGNLHDLIGTCSTVSCSRGRVTMTKEQAEEMESCIASERGIFGEDAKNMGPEDVRVYLQKESPNLPFKKGDQIPAHLPQKMADKLGLCGEFRVCLNENPPYTEMD